MQPQGNLVKCCCWGRN